jgi:hypothetical protein
MEDQTNLFTVATPITATAPITIAKYFTILLLTSTVTSIEQYEEQAAFLFLLYSGILSGSYSNILRQGEPLGAGDFKNHSWSTCIHKALTHSTTTAFSSFFFCSFSYLASDQRGGSIPVLYYETNTCTL